MIVDHTDSDKSIRDIIQIPSRELSETEYREWITGLEDALTQSPESVDRHTAISHDYKLDEALTPGIYVRELTMPAGQLVVSRIHMETHPFCILEGEVTVYDGKGVQHIKAPYKGVTIAGTKRVLYVHRDTRWITFHPYSGSLDNADKDNVITCSAFSDYDKLKEVSQ
jgi:hypothetical protein